MKRFIITLTFLLICLVTFGQTYTYRCTKVVSESGEIFQGDGHKVTITFHSGMSSFYVSDLNGNRCGAPSGSSLCTGYNNYVPIQGSGIYLQRQVRDPQDFYFTTDTGKYKEYRNTRPILFTMMGQTTVDGYDYDYARFNSDYSRINLIPAAQLGSQGIAAFGCIRNNYSPSEIYVFERVEAANNGDFY